MKAINWFFSIVAVVALAACGGGSTSSGGDGPDSTTPETPAMEAAGIEDIELDSTLLVIGGSSVPYSIVLSNPTDTTLSVVAVQAFIEQSGATRAAGGAQVSGCGASLGELAPGECTHSFNISASNTNAGSGTLEAGPATARFELREDGVVIDQIEVDVALFDAV